MSMIKQTQIDAAEPMTVIGRSEAGDWLLKDRDGRIRSLLQSELSGAWFDAKPNSASRPKPKRKAK